MNYSISGKQLVFLLTITFIIACTSVDDSLLTIIIFWGSILFLQCVFSLVNKLFLSQAPFSSAFKKQHQLQEFISESDCEASPNQETFESVQLLFSGTPENFYTSPVGIGKLWDRSASSSENRLCSNPPIQENSDRSNEESEKDQLQENKCFKAPKILEIVTTKNDDDVRQNKNADERDEKSNQQVTCVAEKETNLLEKPPGSMRLTSQETSYDIRRPDKRVDDEMTCHFPDRTESFHELQAAAAEVVDGDQNGGGGEKER